MCVNVSYYWWAAGTLAPPISVWMGVNGWMMTCSVKELWVVRRLEKRNTSTGPSTRLAWQQHKAVSVTSLSRGEVINIKFGNVVTVYGHFLGASLFVLACGNVVPDRVPTVCVICALVLCWLWMQHAQKHLGADKMSERCICKNIFAHTHTQMHARTQRVEWTWWIID